MFLVSIAVLLASVADNHLAFQSCNPSEPHQQWKLLPVNTSSRLVVIAQVFA
jgi:hypothetical protein